LARRSTADSDGKKSSANRDEWLDSKLSNPLTSVGARLPAIGRRIQYIYVAEKLFAGKRAPTDSVRIQQAIKNPMTRRKVAGLSGDALRSVSSAKGESMNARMITHRD
jgi:hypothetical protein